MSQIFYYPWEAAYLRWFQHLGEGTPLQSILLFLNNIFSAFGEEIIGVLILGFLYWCIDKEKGRRVGLMIIMASVTNGMIKNIFRRLRPYQSIDGIQLLREVDGYSFPSGHSAHSAAMYPALAYEFREKKWKWLTVTAICLPVLVALSRNYLGAHWPTDVLVGLLQGLLIMILVEVFSTRIRTPWILPAICLILALCGMFYCRTDDFFASVGLLVGFFCGTTYEQRFVNFEMPARWYFMALRTILGGLCFLAVNALLKMLLGGIFEAETYGYWLLRVVRYGITTFTVIGIYPYLFRLEKQFHRV